MGQREGRGRDNKTRGRGTGKEEEEVPKGGQKDRERKGERDGATLSPDLYTTQAYSECHVIDSSSLDGASSFVRSVSSRSLSPFLSTRRKSNYSVLS